MLARIPIRPTARWDSPTIPVTSDAAALPLHFLGDRKFRLMTNNPTKVNNLTQYGLNHIEQVKHVAGVGDANRRYLKAKRLWGHKIADDDL